MSRKRHGQLWQTLLGPGMLENAWGGVLSKYPRAERPPAIHEFAQEAPRRLASLRQQLERGVYVPQPAALVEIPKPHKPGQTRPISVLRPEDRIVLSALHRVLEPAFERQFPDGSHAYRRGRGVSSCARAVEHHLRTGFRHVAGADIHRYFENIPRPALLNQLRELVWEYPILDLMEVYLAMGAVARRRGLPQWVESDRGIAQGSPLSPLLANLYLLPFDRFLDAGAGTEAARMRWVRYADNYLVFARDRNQAAAANENAIAFLKQHLQLEVNGDSRILTGDQDGFLFLGFLFQDGKRRLSPLRIQEMSEALRAEVRALNRKPLEGLRRIAVTVEGWRHYYENALEPETWAHFDTLLSGELRRWVGRIRDKEAGDAPGGEELERALTALQTPIPRAAEEMTAWVKQLLAPRRDTRPAAAEGTPSPRARKAVAQRRREIEQARTERMELLISQPGSALGRRGERIVVRRDGEEIQQIPFRSVRHLTITHSAVSLSGELLIEAASRGIEIHVLGGYGRQEVRIGAAESPQYHTSLLQLQASESLAGLDLARRFLVAKTGNQENLLRYFLKYRNRANEEFRQAGESAVATIAAVQARLRALEWTRSRGFTPEERLRERDQLFAMEAQAAGAYWRALGVLLRGRASFVRREHRGAKDLVNSLLNYGYGILYSRVMEALLRGGLNPNISFLHAPRPNKPTLLFDVIEEFRPPVVDRAVCALLGRGVALALSEDGKTLDQDSRRTLARSILNQFQASTRYRGGCSTLDEILHEQVRGVLRHLKGEQPYKGFVMPW